MSYGQDLDLSARFAPPILRTDAEAGDDDALTPEERAEDAARERRLALARADRIRFPIWDGRVVEMQRLKVGLFINLEVEAYRKEPESPMAANVAGKIDKIRASLVSVGDQRLDAGTTSEDLLRACGSRAIPQLRDAFDLLHDTTEEEDAAFLAGIEVL